MKIQKFHHYKQRTFAFDDVSKFENLRQTLEQLAALSGGHPLVSDLKQKLIRSESFLIRKFCLLVVDFLADEFWTTPDDLYELPAAAPGDKSALLKSLRAAYRARSSYVHEGRPFPAYIEFGLHDTVSLDVAIASMNVLAEGKDFNVPAFIWFERMAHLVIREYVRRSFAPEIAKARELSATEKPRLQEVIRNLDDKIRESLRKSHAKNRGHWVEQGPGLTD